MATEFYEKRRRKRGAGLSVSVDSAEREVYSDFWCLAPHSPSSRDAGIEDAMSAPHPASAAAPCNCLCWERLTPR